MFHDLIKQAKGDAEGQDFYCLRTLNGYYDIFRSTSLEAVIKHWTSMPNIVGLDLQLWAPIRILNMCGEGFKMVVSGVVPMETFSAVSKALYES